MLWVGMATTTSFFLPPTHDEDESFTEPSHPRYPEPFNPFLRNKGTAWQIKMEMCRI